MLKEKGIYQQWLPSLFWGFQFALIKLMLKTAQPLFVTCAVLGLLVLLLMIKAAITKQSFQLQLVPKNFPRLFAILFGVGILSFGAALAFEALNLQHSPVLFTGSVLLLGPLFYRFVKT